VESILTDIIAGGVLRRTVRLDEVYRTYWPYRKQQCDQGGEAEQRGGESVLHLCEGVCEVEGRLPQLCLRGSGLCRAVVSVGGGPGLSLGSEWAGVATATKTWNSD
jgi:hypothetical protein